jgi:hypothetical protein
MILRFLASFRDTLRRQRIQKDEVSGRKVQRMAKNIQKSNNKIRKASNNVQSNNHIPINNDTPKILTMKTINILKRPQKKRKKVPMIFLALADSSVS